MNNPTSQSIERANQAKQELFKLQFRSTLIELWNEYTQALIERERGGGAHYDDTDFTLDNFMHWLVNGNYLTK